MHGFISFVFIRFLLLNRSAPVRRTQKLKRRHRSRTCARRNSSCRKRFSFCSRTHARALQSECARAHRAERVALRDASVYDFCDGHRHPMETTACIPDMVLVRFISHCSFRASASVPAFCESGNAPLGSAGDSEGESSLSGVDDAPGAAPNARPVGHCAPSPKAVADVAFSYENKMPNCLSHPQKGRA